MIVFGRLRRPHIAAVVVRQIAGQKAIAFFYRTDLFQTHFLDQPILMRAVVSFHAPFGLWGTGRDDTNAELGAHPPKLRYRYFATQFLLRCWFLTYTFFQSVYSALGMPYLLT